MTPAAAPRPEPAAPAVALPPLPDAAWLGVGLLWLALLLIPLAAAWGRSPDLAHGWAAPLLMLHLWWERLPRSGPRRVSPPSGLRNHAVVATLVALVLAASGLRLFLEPFPLWPAVLAAHSVALVAIGGLLARRVGGPALAGWLLAPCLVLAGALPWPGVVDRVIIQPLREALASLAAECVTLLAQPAIAEGTSVRLAGGWVGIDEACGGIRSLQAAVMIALFFGELGRFGATRRILLLLAGVASALAGNLARILYLALAAAGSGEKARAAHDTAGWLALGLTLVGVGAMAWLLRPRHPSTPTPAADPAAAPSTPSAPAVPPPAAARPASAGSLRPGLSRVLPSLLTLAACEVAVRAWFTSGESRQTAISQWEARLPEGRSDYRAEPLGDLARELLQPDAYQAGRWRDTADGRAAAYSIEWHRGQLARTLPFLHNPTVCLPLAGCELREERDAHAFHLDDLSLPFRSYLFARAGEEFLVSFIVWDPTRGAPLNQPEDTPDLFAWLATRWTEVRERRRHQPAQMLCVAVYGENAERRTSQILESIIHRK